MNTPTKLQGYQAAFKVIEKMADLAERSRPKRAHDKQSAAYRQGYADAMAFCSCMAALGEFPQSNIESIKANLA